MDVSYTGQVTYSAPVSKGIILLRIKLLQPNSVAFKAGQYLEVLLPDTDNSAFYSIASSPRKRTEIELLIKEDLLGKGACYLFSLKVGDSIKFNMPFGEAYLREESKRNLIFVAGSSGASYIRSMIHYLDEIDQLSHRKVFYFLGTREESELMEPDYMHRLDEKNLGFHFIPALSHQEDWDGQTGLITDVIKRVMPNDLSSWDAYSAGSPAMVKAVANTLITDHQLPPEHFFSDLYTPEI